MSGTHRGSKFSREGSALAAGGVEPLEARRMMHGGPRIVFADPLTAIGDFNNDKKADVVGVQGATIQVGKKKVAGSLVTVEAGLGNGVFVPVSGKTVAGIAAEVAVGDFNGDKNADVALLSADSAGAVSVQFLYGNGKGKLGDPTAAQVLGDFPLADVAAGDLSGDGYADLMTLGADGSTYVALNSGAAAPGTLLAPIVQSNPFGDVDPVGFGDVDNDGRPDLLGVAESALFFNKWAINFKSFINTNGTTQASELDLTGKRLIVADVDGNGANDLVAVGDGSVSVALGNGAIFGDFFAWTTQSFTGLSAATVATGDVNGDGRADLLQVKSGPFVGRAKLLLVGGTDGLFQKLSFGGRGRDAWDDRN